MTAPFSTSSFSSDHSVLRAERAVIHSVDNVRQVLLITTTNGSLHELLLQDVGCIELTDLWEGAVLGLVDIRLHPDAPWHRAVVLEPEYVVDVTEVAEVMGAAVPHAQIALMHRTDQRGATAPMASGTLLNSVFDMLAADPNLSDTEVMRDAVRTRAMPWAKIWNETGSIDPILDRARALIPRLRSALAGWQQAELGIEPYVISPTVGLQGRFDLQVTEADGRHLIEIKGGTAPRRGVRPSHESQLAAYALLHAALYDRWPATSALWYVAAEEAPFRSIGTERLLTVVQQTLRARNAIVVMDRALSRRSFDALRTISPDLPGLSSYDRVAAEHFATRYRQADPTTRTMVQAWFAFLHRERWIQRWSEQGNRSRASLWRTSYAEKVQDPSCVTGLRLASEASDRTTMHLAFTADDSIMDCSLRTGDLVIVHEDRSALPDAAVHAIRILKGTVTHIDERSIHVTLRNKQASFEELESHRWIVESEVADGTITNLLPSVMSVLDDPSVHRDVLLGKRPPRSGASDGRSSADLDPDQEVVVNAALSARDYFLIQGPPGTGKTSRCLRSIVQRLLQQPAERILVMAYTNRAVAEICAVLDRVLPADTYLRHGSASGTQTADPRTAIPRIGREVDPATLAERIANARCIVSTVHSLHSSPEIFAFGRFTTAVVDEASQILEPQLIGILCQTERAILIGDHFQLPPVVAQEPEERIVQSPLLAEVGLTDLGMTTFERLYRLCQRNQWNDAIATLQRQGRMHHDVMRFPSEAFYGGTLQTAEAWQDDPTPTAWATVLPHRAMFIPVRADHQAAAEARIVADLVIKVARAAADVGHTPSIGVITPFRVQNRAIWLLLPEDLQQTVTIDTVERFQGSQRDVIFFAASVGNSVELRNIRSDVEVEGRFVDRKLNVACTRAREQFVLVGHPEVLAEASVYANAISVLTWHYGS